MLEISAIHYQMPTNPPFPTNIYLLIPPKKISNGFYKEVGCLAETAEAPRSNRFG
jgi:hypothetical protein